MKEHLIAGIDLGSSAIRLAVGQVVVGPDKRETLNIVGASEVLSQGISKGLVSSLEDAVTSITACLEQAERQIGLPISEAYVGISGSFVQTQLAKGVIGISRPDGEVREEDVHRVLESVRASTNPANVEILHILPRGFSVDGQHGIHDPIGMQGIRLEVDAYLIQGQSTSVRNITKAVFRTNLEITELVYAPLAVGDAITTSRQREVGVAVVNIGASTTTMTVYEEGRLLHACSIPVGSDYITADIAIGLRTSLDIAEQLKRTCADAVAEHVNEYEQIDVRDLGADQSEYVSPRFVSDIAEARVEEIFDRIESELKKIDRSGMLPAGVVLTGGGVKLRGLVEAAKRTLRLPVSIGTTSAISSPLLDVIQDSAFSTAVGLVVWGYSAEREEGGVQTNRISKGGDWLKKFGSPLKKIFKSFVP